jgi:hypothetical protein
MKEILIATSFLSGLIVDSETKEPIPAARIEVLDCNEMIYTDFDGNFKLDCLNDTSKIRISFISYNDTIISFEDLKNNLTVNLSTY